MALFCLGLFFLTSTSCARRIKGITDSYVPKKNKNNTELEKDTLKKNDKEKT